MSVSVEKPLSRRVYVESDGTLNLDGLVLIEKLYRAVQELQARVDALEALHP